MLVFPKFTRLIQEKWSTVASATAIPRQFNASGRVTGCPSIFPDDDQDPANSKCQTGEMMVN